ncbi:unnamed protein product, partial [Tetraodon nigroviridis]
DMYQKEENISVTAAGGVIQSPRYPNAYPRDLVLSWKLLSPPGTRIHLEFDGQFGLEDAENGVCSYDFVEVEDLSETSTIIWGRWCGHKAPPSLNSKANMLKVTFKSDDYFVAKPGFKVYYTMLGVLEMSAWTPKESLTSLSVSCITRYTQREGLRKPTFTGRLHDKGIKQAQGEKQLESVVSQYHNPGSDSHRVWDGQSSEIQNDQSKALSLLPSHMPVDLNRLHDDVKRYSCTPRNYSVNLQKELRATNAIFFTTLFACTTMWWQLWMWDQQLE